MQLFDFLSSLSRSDVSASKPSASGMYDATTSLSASPALERHAESLLETKQQRIGSNPAQLTPSLSKPITLQSCRPFWSPLNLPLWRRLLAEHPSPDTARTLLNGIEKGVAVGYEGKRERVSCRNLSSALEFEAAVEADLLTELKLGRIAGPFATPPFEKFRCSPLGTVPKKGTSKRRRIHHLSWPHGSSVNDGITDYSVEYARFDHLVAMVLMLGIGCLLSKIDLKDAFRHLAVSPNDYELLGFIWRGLYFFDRFLPFGLRSSPRWFELFATAFQWILQFHGNIRNILHYLDDYIIGGPARSLVCSRDTEIMLMFCQSLGWQVNMDKREGPATQITFLGAIVDSILMEARISPERVKTISEALAGWAERDACTKRELQSLIGVLSFASKVVRAGRAFLQRMLNLCRGQDQSPAKLIPLSADFQRDIKWWRTFISEWNGRSLLPTDWTSATSLMLETDAADFGAGAFYKSHWFSHPWSDTEKAFHINVRELLALTLAAATWGHLWAGKQVTFFCDNLVVVQAVSSFASRNDDSMDLIRSLFMIAARFDFNFRVLHIAGLDNSRADALSRGQMLEFRNLAPQADLLPTRPQHERILRF